jgi:hypothetical protein
MHIRMEKSESLTPSQIREFLQGSQGIQFAGQSRPEVYAWVERTLVGQEQGTLSP